MRFRIGWEFFKPTSQFLNDMIEILDEDLPTHPASELNQHGPHVLGEKTL